MSESSETNKNLLCTWKHQMHTCHLELIKISYVRRIIRRFYYHLKISLIQYVHKSIRMHTDHLKLIQNLLYV